MDIVVDLARHLSCNDVRLGTVRQGHTIVVDVGLGMGEPGTYCSSGCESRNGEAGTYCSSG